MKKIYNISIFTKPHLRNEVLAILSDEKFLESFLNYGVETVSLREIAVDVEHDTATFALHIHLKEGSDISFNLENEEILDKLCQSIINALGSIAENRDDIMLFPTEMTELKCKRRL